MSEVTGPIRRSRSEPIRFLTFNVRLDTVSDEAAGNGWPVRLASVLETIRRADADIAGFQEVRRSQLHDLSEALPDRQGVGKPREAGDLGEYVPIFFRRSRFEREDGGDFWLSTTPETEGSIGWDASSPRHCTWVRLRDKIGERRFAVLNTHLDVRGPLARVEAARLIAARSAVAPRAPTVLLGDMNAEEDSEPLRILRAAGFRDTFRDLHPAARDVQTVHHYVDLSGTRKIDYVLCDAAWDVECADIVRQPAAGRLPSDHFPVIADLRHIRPSEPRGTSELKSARAFDRGVYEEPGSANIGREDPTRTEGSWAAFHVSRVFMAHDERSLAFDGAPDRSGGRADHSDRSLRGILRGEP